MLGAHVRVRVEASGAWLCSGMEGCVCFLGYLRFSPSRRHGDSQAQAGGRAILPRGVPLLLRAPPPCLPRLGGVEQLVVVHSGAFPGVWRFVFGALSRATMGETGVRGRGVLTGAGGGVHSLPPHSCALERRLV